VDALEVRYVRGRTSEAAPPEGSFEAAGSGNRCGAAAAGVACENNGKEVFPWYVLVTLELFRTACAFQPKFRVLSGAPGDCSQGAGDGCRVCFFNLWALGWFRDL
jgi:hypothetical protein